MITFTFWDIICDWCVALLQYFDTLSENFYWLAITLSPVKADRQLKSLFQSHITSRLKLCGKSRRHFVFVVSSFPKTRTSGDQIGFLFSPLNLLIYKYSMSSKDLFLRTKVRTEQRKLKAAVVGKPFKLKMMPLKN